jgi:hypothetical protein
MVEGRPFATMRGMDVLTFVRDAIADEAALKRSFIEASERIAGGSTDPAIRQRMAALDAAADAFSFIIGCGQEERQRCAEDPRRRFPEWITRLANQARMALIEPEPDNAEKEPAEG